jgi:predicted negative regulator of RcsB-dependent stress response
MYDELDRAAQAGDAAKTARVFADLRERFPGTAYAEQGGLLAAKLQLDKGQADAASQALTWVAEHAKEDAYRTLARIRLAGVLMDQKRYDDALKQLSQAGSGPFDALVADRRGDVLLAQGKAADARTAYQAAWKAMEPTLEYRRLVEAKLIALGAPPQPPADAAPGARS